MKTPKKCSQPQRHRLTVGRQPGGLPPELLELVEAAGRLDFQRHTYGPAGRRTAADHNGQNLRPDPPRGDPARRNWQAISNRQIRFVALYERT